MRLSKEEQARREGMSYALRIAKEKGIEGLEEELKFRNAVNIPVGVSQKQVNDFVEETKNTILDTVLLMSVNCIRDEFGMGKTRCERFVKRFNSYSESLVGEYVTWAEIAEAMKDEMGLDFHIRSDDRRLKC